VAQTKPGTCAADLKYLEARRWAGRAATAQREPFSFSAETRKDLQRILGRKPELIRRLEVLTAPFNVVGRKNRASPASRENPQVGGEPLTVRAQHAFALFGLETSLRVELEDQAMDITHADGEAIVGLDEDLEEADGLAGALGKCGLAVPKAVPSRPAEPRKTATLVEHKDAQGRRHLERSPVVLGGQSEF